MTKPEPTDPPAMSSIDASREPRKKAVNSAAKSVAGKAKTAGRVAKLNAKIASIETALLPKAFFKLGKSVFGSAVGKQQFQLHCQRISDLQRQIESISEAADQRVETDGVSGKAKSLAKSGADAARTKLLQGKIKKEIYELGKAAYGLRVELSLPPAAVVSIDNLHAEKKHLSEELAKLSTETAGSPFLRWRWLHIVLLYFWGLGLIPIWLSSHWSRKAKVGLTIAIIAWCISGVGRFGTGTPWLAEELALVQFENPSLSEEMSEQKPKVSVEGFVIGAIVNKSGDKMAIDMLGAGGWNVRCMIEQPFSTTEDLIHKRVLVSGDFGGGYISSPPVNRLTNSEIQNIDEASLPARSSVTLSREQMLGILKSLGAKLGRDRFKADGITKQSCVLRATIEQLTAVFGEPEILSDRYDSFNDADYQRWRFQCHDGPLTFHGNTLPGSTPPLTGSLQLQSVVVCFY